MADKSSPPDPTSAGTQSIRSTAKWLVAAFGALGSALITSLQLKDLGTLSGSDKEQAILGFSLAIAGVLIALVMTSLVLSAKVATLDEMKRPGTFLNEYIRDNPQLLSGFDSIDALSNLYDEVSKTRIDSYLEFQRLTLALAKDNSLPALPAQPAQPALPPTSAEAESSPEEKAPIPEWKKFEETYDDAVQRLGLVNPAVTQLLNIGVFEKIRRQWKLALPAIAIGVVLATIGTGLFATADTTTSMAVPIAAVVPGHAVLDLNTVGREQLGEALGKNCPLGSVGVLVLDVSSSGWDVVTEDKACQTIQVTVPSSDATIQRCSVMKQGSTAASAIQNAAVHSVGYSSNESKRSRSPVLLTGKAVTDSGPCPPIAAG